MSACCCCCYCCCLSRMVSAGSDEVVEGPAQRQVCQLRQAEGKGSVANHATWPIHLPLLPTPTLSAHIRMRHCDGRPMLAVCVPAERRSIGYDSSWRRMSSTLSLCSVILQCLQVVREVGDWSRGKCTMETHGSIENPYCYLN